MILVWADHWLVTSPVPAEHGPDGRAQGPDGDPGDVLEPAGTVHAFPLRGGDRRRLGDILVDHGTITVEELAHALETQQQQPPRERRRIGVVIVELGLATERQVAEALGEHLGLAVVDLTRMTVAPEMVRSLPRAVAERARCLVLGRNGDRMLVATSDPTNVVALDDVKLYTGAADLDVVVAPDSQLQDYLNRAWSLAEDSSGALDAFSDLDISNPEDEDGTGGPDDAPTVRLVNMILSDAVRVGASDIHIEPQRDALRIRYRVDGVLRDVMSVPRKVANSVISRMKIVSGLDIAERRVPQDGRTRINLEGGAIDARVSTLPSIHGEKVVIRLLTRSDKLLALDGIGVDEEQLTILRRAMEAPQGLILITGPTGSGKTNTLYSALAEIHTPERNIITLEDPVEVQVPGITQVQINERTGLTFSRGLRSVLRQDPDVVLVGEIRDQETAELALKASLTGHLVLSTLHTNSAVAALTRLVDMGIEPFLVATSLTCVVAQRLVRRPCSGCLVDDDPDPALLAALGLTPDAMTDATARRGAGCSECQGSGYRGRVGIFEVVDVDATLRRVLTTSPTEAALTEATSHLPTLRDAAIAAAYYGETTFEEAVRVSPRD